MAVYRTPVDRTGAAWQLSSLTTPPEPEPGLRQRLQTLSERITEAQAAGSGPDINYGLPPETITEYQAAMEELRQPPVDLDEQVDNALKRLLDLGLVSPAPAPQDEPGHEPSGLTVHHWTADALRKGAHPDTLKAAHHRAAAYWQWRVNVWPQPRTDAITQLIEARHHHHQAGDLDQADIVTGHVCSQLHTWGAWDWEQHLLEETLTWVSARSHPAAAYIHHLGMIAELRGDYQQAEERYRASLTIFEELGDRAGIASTYHQLGVIAQLRGNYQQAEERYRASLTIKEELGNRAGIAISYGQLGMLRTEQQRPSEGVPYMLQALALVTEIGSPPGAILHWLGRQRDLLGDDAFRFLLDDMLSDEVAAVVMDLTQPATEPPPPEGSTGPENLTSPDQT
jgi:tetratricopeptide (TPR) repeat protein